MAELADAAGLDLGFSGWRTIDRAAVSAYRAATSTAGATPDDSDRVPELQVLSLVPTLLGEVLRVSDRSAGLNYGASVCRFPQAVHVGDSLRLHASLSTVERRGALLCYELEVTIEVASRHEPALVGTVAFCAR
jgi:acyl dehydratase